MLLTKTVIYLFSGHIVFRKFDEFQNSLNKSNKMFNTFRKEMDKVSLEYNRGCYTVAYATLLIDYVLLSPVVKETKGSGEGSEHVVDTL